ncbi:MAG: DUF3833 domain-containing protein [Ectothiorhodospiraceae bacterium]
MPKRVLAALVALALLSGCAGMAPEDYAGTRPPFKLEEYFSGPVRAWGMFQDRSGDVKRRFTVDINGRMDGDVFVLEEDFQYLDGETDQRVWRIKRLDEHHYEGRAADVVGVAKGTVYGSALNWQYTLALETDDDTWHLQFDDWMYRMPDGVLINRAEVTKFGFRVGEVTIFFRKGG